MQDFERRKIQTYEKLKRQLETCYITKQSTTYLQIDFNSLRNRTRQHTFGQRIDLLTMKLYESMIEGRQHSLVFKNAIQQKP